MTAGRAEKTVVSALGRRFAARLVGEGIQSIYHFGLNVALIRLFSPYDYGSFSIIFMTGVMAILFSDALFAIPASVYVPGRRPAAAKVLEVTLGSVALALSIAIAGVAALVMSIWLGSFLTGSLAGGFVGLWALRNYTRAVALTRSDVGGAIRATLSDLSYSVLGAVLLVVTGFALRLPLTLTSVFACLCAASAVGVLLASLGGARRIRVSFRPRRLRRYAALWPEIAWSLVGVGTAVVQGQSQMFLVACLAGPAAFAPIAAGFVLVSPIRIVSGSVLSVLRPELSRRRSAVAARSTSRMLAFSGLCLIAFCGIYGLCLFAGWPFLRSELYARSFGGEPMGLIVAIAWLTATTYTGYQPIRALAQSRSRFREIALASMVGGSAGFLIVLALLLLSDPPTSTFGVVAGEAVTLVLLWRLHQRSLAEEMAIHRSTMSARTSVDTPPQRAGQGASLACRNRDGRSEGQAASAVPAAGPHRVAGGERLMRRANDDHGRCHNERV